MAYGTIIYAAPSAVVPIMREFRREDNGTS